MSVTPEENWFRMKNDMLFQFWIFKRSLQYSLSQHENLTDNHLLKQECNSYLIHFLDDLNGERSDWIGINSTCGWLVNASIVSFHCTTFLIVLGTCICKGVRRASLFQHGTGSNLENSLWKAINNWKHTKKLKKKGNNKMTVKKSVHNCSSERSTSLLLFHHKIDLVIILVFKAAWVLVL